MSKFKVVVCVELRTDHGSTIDSRDFEVDPEDGSEAGALGPDIEEAIEEMLDEAQKTDRKERLNNVLGALEAALEGTALTFPLMREVEIDEDDAEALFQIGTPDGPVSVKLQLSR